MSRCRRRALPIIIALVAAMILSEIGANVSENKEGAAPGAAPPPTDSQKEYGTRTEAEANSRPKIDYDDDKLWSSMTSEDITEWRKVITPRMKEMSIMLLERCSGYVGGNSSMTVRDMAVFLRRLLVMPADAKALFCNPGGSISPKPGSISPKTLQFLNLKILTYLKPDVLLQLKNLFTNDHKSILCKKIHRETVAPNVISSIQDLIGEKCSTVMVNQLKGDDGFAKELSRSDKESFVRDMRKEKAATLWSPDEWKAAFKVPEAVDADLIGEMDETDFELGLQSEDLFNGLKRKDQKKAFVEKAKAVLGDVDKWVGSTVRKVGNFLKDLDIDDLKRIPSSALADAAKSIGEMKFTKEEFAKKLSLEKKAVESLGDAKTWDAIKLKNAASLVKGDRKVLGQVDMSVLAESVDELGKLEFEKGEASYMAKKLRQTNKFKNLKAISTVDLLELGNITKGLGRAELDSMPDEAIAGAFESLKTIKFPHKGQKRLLLRKAQKAGKIKSFDQLTPLDLEDLGELVEGLKVEDLKQMPAAAIAGNIRELGRKKMDMAQKAQIIEKMKSSGALGEYVSSLGPLMQNIGLKEIHELDAHDLGLDDETMPLTLEPLPQQAMDIFDKIKEMYGRLSEENGNYTTARMANWGQVAALGMNKLDIENFKKAEETLDIFESMGQFIEEMSDMQERAIARKIKDIWNAADETSMRNLTDVNVRKSGRYLKHFVREELERLDPTNRAIAVEEIGFTSLHNIPATKLKEMAKFALRNILSNNQVVDRTNAQSLTSEDLQTFGSLVCGLEVSDIGKLSKDALEDQLYVLGKCPFESERMKALYDRVKAMESDLLTSADKLAVAGTTLMHAPSEDLSTMNKKELAMVLHIIIDQFKEREEAIKRRQELSIIDLSDDDLAAQREKKKALLVLGIEALLATSVARRRRSTSNVECNEIEQMGSGVTALTTAQIDSIASVDFTNCGGTLGSQSAWSTEQLSSLSSKAKQVFGNPNTWTAETISEMGSIVAGLSVDEIKQLQLDQIEPLFSVGKHGLLSADQLKAGVDRWAALVKNSDYTSVTAAELKSIGHFACGLTASDIPQIPDNTYSGAATVLGTLNSCDTSKMAAYASKAKSVYGNDVSAWAASTVTEIGYMIGGLSKSEIGSLQSGHVDVISPMVLKKIPAENFAGFSDSILRTMSESQARSVTSSQLAGLSQTQLDALVEAGADASIANGNGGNPGSSSSGTNLGAFSTGLISLGVVTALMNGLLTI